MSNQTSPVVYAECRFSGSPKWLHVGVWFTDKQELDQLINALMSLRDTTGDDYDHVHLQQHGMSPRSEIGSAEIMFYRPGRMIQEVEKELIADAKDWLRAAQR